MQPAITQPTKIIHLRWLNADPWSVVVNGRAAWPESYSHLVPFCPASCPTLPHIRHFIRSLGPHVLRCSYSSNHFTHATA